MDSEGTTPELDLSRTPKGEGGEKLPEIDPASRIAAGFPSAKLSSANGWAMVW